MSALTYLIPTSLVLGLIGLGCFLWSLRSRQYEDLEGAAARILLDDDSEGPETPDRDRPGGPGSPPEECASPGASSDTSAVCRPSRGPL